MSEWDDLASCYARLQAIRTNLADADDIEMAYVTEYDGILTRLTSLGYVLTDFRIAPESAEPRVVAVLRRTPRSLGGPQYSDERYVSGTMFRIKLDGLLNLFTLNAERPSIGFNAPRA